MRKLMMVTDGPQRAHPLRTHFVQNTQVSLYRQHYLIIGTIDSFVFRRQDGMQSVD